MLATPIDKPFSQEGWIFELKYDGIRAMVSVAGDGIRITGRRGGDETSRYPEARAIRVGIRARQAVVDGELVVLDADGRPSFERLQQRINVVRAPDVLRVATEHPVTFVAFDLLRLEDRDLLSTELRIRKKTLRETIVDSPHILFAEHVERDGIALFEEARTSGIEGIVGKRADSVYRPGVRSPDWVKIKSWRSQSCVIVGYTAGRGRRSNQLGALILAVFDNGRLVHCGQVGTGFDDKTLRDLKERLRPLVVDVCPLDTVPKTSEPATWVKPELVCEVRFSEWTREGMLRHPAFRTLRPDQRIEDTFREKPSSDPESRATAPSAESRATAPAPGGAARRRRSREPKQPVKRSTTVSARRSSGGVAGGSAAGVLGDEDASPTSKDDKPKETKRGGGEGPPRRQDPDINNALQTLKTLHGNAHWEIAGRRLPLTNLDKVLWPADGLTKRDMIEYYVRMADYMLPYLRDRPLSMQVFPDGIDGKSFWRKDKPAHAPAWIESWTYHGEKTKTYIVVNEVATLAWVANAGVIDLHPWHSRIDQPDAPDWAVFDLDPFEPATFRRRHRHRQARQGRARPLRDARRHQDQRTDRAADLRPDPARPRLRGGAPLGGGGGTGDRSGGAGQGELGVGGRKAHRAHSHRLHAEHHQQDAGRTLLTASGARRSGFDAHRLGGARRSGASSRPLDDHLDRAASCRDRRPFRARVARRPGPAGTRMTCARCASGR